MNQIKELRHDGECSDIALVQRPQQFGSVQRFEIYDARSLDQREKQVGHLGQHVKQGQHAEQSVARAKFDPVKNGFDLAQKIRVSQHHALGIGGSARGVEQGSEIIVVGGCWLEPG